MDKTGKNIGAVSLTLHISIYYISGRNWATEKQKDIVFLKKYWEYLTSPTQNSTCANVIRNTTQKEKHKVLTKSKKKENTLWRTGNGIKNVEFWVLSFELCAARILNYWIRNCKLKTQNWKLKTQNWIIPNRRRRQFKIQNSKFKTPLSFQKKDVFLHA